MTAVNALAPQTLVTPQPAAPAWIGSGDAGAPAEIGQGSAAPFQDIPKAPAAFEPPPKPSPEQAAKNLADAEAALREAESVWAAEKSRIEAKYNAELIEINKRPLPAITLARQIADAQGAAENALWEAQRPVELLRRSVDAMRDSDPLGEARSRFDQATTLLDKARAEAEKAEEVYIKADLAYRAALANDPNSMILDYRDMPPL